MAASTWLEPNILTDMRIVAEGLACDRGGRRIFRDVSFALSGGEMWELRGPNGSGKSSLLRVLAGLLPQAGGTLEIVDGPQDLSLGEQAHYVSHADAIKLSLTPIENLAFWSAFSGGGDAASALSSLNLSAVANFATQHLSSGQRRRLGLARLLLSPRKLWLLDEPTTGLDDASRFLFAGVLNSHVAAGGVVVAATHISLGVTVTGVIELKGA